MATLIIPDVQQTLTNENDIRDFLKARGIFYDVWEASVAFSDDANEDTILEAYAHQLQPFMEKNGYQTADVISVNSNTPNLPELRKKFLREHTHTEDEIRFFVDGQGYFWFHQSEQHEVFWVKCVAGDLLSVPAGVTHWFDMGEPAFVKTIRVFTDVSGWTPHYTNSGIEQQYQAALPC